MIIFISFYISLHLYYLMYNNVMLIIHFLIYLILQVLECIYNLVQKHLNGLFDSTSKLHSLICYMFTLS
jgi:hypothetical protein